MVKRIHSTTSWHNLTTILTEEMAYDKIVHAKVFT